MARYNTEKEHYESLTKILKWTVSSTLLAIGLITAVGAFIFWDNAKDMREEFRNEFNEKKDAVEKNMQNQSIALENRKKEIDEELTKFESRVDKQISETQSKALAEIEYIKHSSVEIAKNEAKSKIYEVFDKNNLDQTIIKVAEEKIIPKVNFYIDRQIESNENNLVEESIDNISSGNLIKLAQSVNYLQVNPRIKITENQAKKIVDAIPKVNPLYKFSIMSILIYRKSEASLSLFKEEILNKDNTTANYAMQYFIFNNIDFNIFENALISSIRKNPESSNRYFEAIDLSSSNNQNYTLNILNSKPLVNYIFAGTEKEYIPARKEQLLNNLKANNWDEDIIKKTYLFQKHF